MKRASVDPERPCEIGLSGRYEACAVIDPAVEKESQEDSWKSIHVIFGGNGGPPEYKLVKKGARQEQGMIFDFFIRR